MANEWRCPQCGNTQQMQSRFCTQCGTQQPANPAGDFVLSKNAGAGSTAAPQTDFSRREMILAGVAALLLLVLCGVGGALGMFLWQQPQATAGNESTATATAEATSPAESEPAPTATDTVEAAAPVTVTAASETAADTPPGATSSDSLGKPVLGEITFAANVTAEMEPVDPADTFAAGIEEVHALFSYQNITPGETWERIWRLDGDEMLRSAEAWSDESEGIFDYFINAGGEPLAPGEWQLELYFRDELVASGSFSIAQARPTPTPTKRPTRAPTSTRAPTATATPQPRASGGSSGSSGGGVYQLAYTKWDGAFHNLFIGNTSGSAERLIIKRAAGPSWSPDGKRLFFFGEQGVNQQYSWDGRVDCEFNTISGGIVALDIPAGEGDICAVYYGPWLCERKSVDINSPPSDVCEQSGLRVFQNLDWKEGTARWANVAGDGSAVAYDAKPGGSYRIYFRSILNTAQYHFELIGEQADWSPDSQRLVYRSGRDNVQGLWMSNRDDTGHVNLTNDGTDAFPAWSPDGRTIAFTRDSGGGNQDIYAMNSDGSNLRRLTDVPGHDILPTFTPSGDIIFRSDRSGSWGIWKMSGSGGNQTQIIANAPVGPDWMMSRMDAR